MQAMQPPAMITAVPIATASAPRQSPFTASIPSRMPPINTSCILPRPSTSPSASIAWVMAASVGTPTCSITSAPPAPVEPCIPSSSTKSKPSL